MDVHICDFAWHLNCGRLPCGQIDGQTTAVYMLCAKISYTIGSNRINHIDVFWGIGRECRRVNSRRGNQRACKAQCGEPIALDDGDGGDPSGFGGIPAIDVVVVPARNVPHIGLNRGGEWNVCWE